VTFIQLKLKTTLRTFITLLFVTANVKWS